MSYEAAREKISNCAASVSDSNTNSDEVLAALNELTLALETDMVQIKTALSHVALLLESLDKE